MKIYVSNEGLSDNEVNRKYFVYKVNIYMVKIVTNTLTINGI